MARRVRRKSAKQVKAARRVRAVPKEYPTLTPALSVRGAVEAGAQVRMPVAVMFWGDRYGRVADPFGHEGGLATHKEDPAPEEIGKRAAAFFARMRKSSQDAHAGGDEPRPYNRRGPGCNGRLHAGPGWGSECTTSVPCAG